MASVDTLKRFDRLLHIYVQLQSKKIVRAHELADQWHVSLRTIYRDIRTLEQAGVPLYGEAGTGYRIVEGYRLPPISLTQEEANSFVSAQKLMAKFAENKTKRDFDKALMKIKAILRTSEKDSIERLEKYIFVKDLKSPRFPNEIEGILHILMKSFEDKKQIVLTYHALHNDSITERQLEPIGIVHESNYWYVYAYCHLRNDYRQFRTDRILKIDLTDIEFKRTHPSIQSYLQEKTEQNNRVPKTKIKIRVGKFTAQCMQWEKAHFGFVHEQLVDEHVEMCFESSDLQNFFPRWLLMYADDIQSIEPPELLKRLQDLAQNVQEALKRV